MNFSSSLSSLSSFVCIVAAGSACTAGAQTLPAAPADTPVVASSTLLAPVPPQRSAQAAAAAATRAVTEPAAGASAIAVPVVALTAASAAAQADTRAHTTLRRPLVPARPHRPQAASAPADDVWRSDTAYASPYATSPYAAPGDPD
ncbi:hypothetical protein C7H84_04855 [Burkholderia sp. Nafp2/4-1b]|nr:hypothetical protein C7H84_04855 [Burkholderia sp. Nafp2/4-1b]